MSIQSMRLPDFILANTERILSEWDAFAKSIWPTAGSDPTDLRDHAAAILLAAARDMQSAQTSQQQSTKSKGLSDGEESAADLNKASREHAVSRAVTGFDLRSVVADGSTVKLSVHNKGAPIPEEFLSRIFEPHIRGPNSKARPGSAGLGLYIASQVALAHKGTIEVASTRSTGTTFTVTLPRSGGSAR
ncbi:MAG: ATP-binding protein [Nibricoccus sp.]